MLSAWRCHFNTFCRRLHKTPIRCTAQLKIVLGHPNQTAASHFDHSSAAVTPDPVKWHFKRSEAHSSCLLSLFSSLSRRKWVHDRRASSTFYAVLCWCSSHTIPIQSAIIIKSMRYKTINLATMTIETVRGKCWFVLQYRHTIGQLRRLVVTTHLRPSLCR